MRKTLFVFAMLLVLLSNTLPAFAQGGPGTQDFYIRDFGACINLPDFTVVSEPDAYNTLYTVPGLFEINFAQFLLPLGSPPTGDNDLYNAMIALLNTVSASNYQRVGFNHPEYNSAAVEFTLDGKRMFGMIYRNQNGTLFFLFADKVVGFDMLAIGRAIFAADAQCKPLNLPPVAHDQVIGNPNDVVITEVQNIPAAQVSLTANGSSGGTTINAGQCATIEWHIDNVQAVYFDGQGVAGHGSIQVCPANTQTYTILVVNTDGSRVEQKTSVTVNGASNNTTDSGYYADQAYYTPYLTVNGRQEWEACPNESVTLEWGSNMAPQSGVNHMLIYNDQSGPNTILMNNLSMPGSAVLIPSMQFHPGITTLWVYAQNAAGDSAGSSNNIQIRIPNACF